jgi:hypothetical protein
MSLPFDIIRCSDIIQGSGRLTCIYAVIIGLRSLDPSQCGGGGHFSHWHGAGTRRAYKFPRLIAAKMRGFLFAICQLLLLSLVTSFSLSRSVGASIGRPAAFGLASSSSKCVRRQRSVTLMGALPPGWQELKDPSSQRSYYYNPNTGTTQWEIPAATEAPPRDGAKKFDGYVSSDIRDRRAEQMEKVIARQRQQDEEKARLGPLALKSNQSAIVLAALFIGVPLGTLLILFLTGTVPNPFEVCIEGGTNC